MSRYSNLPDGVAYSGVVYKDILALSLDTTNVGFVPATYALNISDTYRFDSFVEYLYGDSELDYALLWLNGKSCCFDLNVNDVLNVYDKTDMYSITH